MFTPIVILKAGALGKPIVATRVGGISEIFKDKEHALLVRPGDEHEFADALRWSLVDCSDVPMFLNSVLNSQILRN